MAEIEAYQPATLELENPLAVMLGMMPVAGRGFRESIIALEERVLAAPQVTLSVCHLFLNGMVARQMFIPKGVVLTGAIHKIDSIAMVLGGSLMLSNNLGQGILKAGDMFVCPAGTKNAGIALEDCFYVCVYRSDATTEEQARADLVYETFEEYDAAMAETLVATVEGA